MKVIVALFFIVFSSVATAQEKIFSFTLNAAQVKLIGDALAERSYKDVHKLIEEMNRQILVQHTAEEKNVSKDK